MEMAQIQLLVSNIVIIAGVIFMAFGVIGLFRFKNFYLRIMSSSKIDTVGTLTIIFGMAIRHGLSFFSAKLLLLAVILIVLGPLCNHMVARSAFLSGHKATGGKGDKPASDKKLEEDERA
ncbi:MAG: monovalent cation/H(+) antiporter subunit G [Oscillospiraceae bacterium]|nr:monovalent cation/H(+) antiporter subunit G [Oscillospiraceae bacterium]